MLLIGLYVFAVRVLVVSGPEKNLILFFFSILGGVAWMGLVMIGTYSYSGGRLKFVDRTCCRGGGGGDHVIE